MARGADLPVIAIVGRPNVGKSTLFNRSVGRRQAVVHDVPGVRRDRLYGQVSFERWQAAVIDTGGFDPSSEEPLIEGVRRQVLTAVEEADLVLLVVDAREGATALDTEIARVLRRTGRPVVLAANKVEGPAQEAGLVDLYRLGAGEPVAISAEHGRGVAELLEVLRARTPASPSPPPRPGAPVHVAVIGRPNVGKSSLVNAMVAGEPGAISAEPARGVAELLGVVRARSPASPSPPPRPGAPVHVAVIGRPNVGKSSLVTAMVGAERVLVHEHPLGAHHRVHERRL